MKQGGFKMNISISGIKKSGENPLAQVTTAPPNVSKKADSPDPTKYLIIIPVLAQ
jgi:hypothetical protein